MSAFLFLTLLLLPILNAERLQTGFENNDDVLMQRSVAASYLCKYFLSKCPHSFFLVQLVYQ
jgi:hypothetical protein